MPESPMRPLPIRSYNDAEYAVLVLLNLKRMLRHSGYLLGFLPPRDLNRNSADSGEVTTALDYAVEAIRSVSPEGEQHGHVREVEHGR